MKYLLAALLGPACAADESFMAYMARYGKSYATREEFEFRQGLYAQNLAKIEEHNQANAGEHVLGENKMMDWTEEEFRRLLGFMADESAGNTNVITPGRESVENIDWRDRGAVTRVKDQGHCGSCWTFSATGAMEGGYYLTHMGLIELSEQQIMDCSTDYGNKGCNGGNPVLAFKYSEQEAIEQEDYYPYTGKEGTCHIEVGSAIVQTYSTVTPKSEAAMLTAV